MLHQDPRIRTLYDKEEVFIGISFDKSLGIHFIHIDIPTNWSLQIFKNYNRIFKEALQNLKKTGITEVYGQCDTVKELKFNQMFGMMFTGIVTFDEKGSPSYLTKKEI